MMMMSRPQFAEFHVISMATSGDILKRVSKPKRKSHTKHETTSIERVVE